MVVSASGMVQMYLACMEDVFRNLEVLALKGRMKQGNRVVITAHRSPDGDAIGSSLAMKHLLAHLGVDAQVIMPDAYAKFLQWLPGHDQVWFHERSPEACEQAMREAQVVFCLDYNAPSRAGRLGPAVEAASQQPEDFADLLVSDPSTASTAELVYRLMKAWEMSDVLDAQMAACLYCGLITDTGSFRFPSVQPSTHDMASHLLKTGMDHSRVHSLIYDACRLDQIQLIAYALSQKLQVFPEHRSAIVSLSQEELRRYNAQKGDTEGLVNRALSIEGINFAAFIKEDVDLVKLSLRSRGAFSVRDVADAHFHGGGHHNAAGGACADESLEEVVDRLVGLLPSFSSALQYED